MSVSLFVAVQQTAPKLCGINNTYFIKLTFLSVCLEFGGGLAGTVVSAGWWWESQLRGLRTGDHWKALPGAIFCLVFIWISVSFVLILDLEWQGRHLCGAFAGMAKQLRLVISVSLFYPMLLPLASSLHGGNSAWLLRECDCFKRPGGSAVVFMT